MSPSRKTENMSPHIRQQEDKKPMFKQLTSNNNTNPSSPIKSKTISSIKQEPEKLPIR
jgi:hypothetical protein